MKTKVLSILILAGLCAGCGNGVNPTPRKANTPSRGPAAHVILIIEENHSYSTVVDQGRMPWLRHSATSMASPPITSPTRKVRSSTISGSLPEATSRNLVAAAINAAMP
jgi:hypothetical protein